jgi:hypothetical protein
MYDIFLDTEYKDRGGDIFLIGMLSSHGEEFVLYGSSLRWNVISRILRNKNRIFVYGPDIGKMEKQFGVDMRSNWKCINVLAIVRKFLPEMPSKSLLCLERLLNLERSTSQFKKITRRLDIHWRNPKLRPGIIDYNMEDVVFLKVCYDILLAHFKFNPDDFRMMPK